ncbi:MAG: 5-carboxymethyl-2-hydroxymuconate isomerase [Planctomycetaceae bacterium]|nr:5-carboxymethyl-2-hydroxymuconate isomerase [Planctomycetaceae bacterium]
MRLIRFLDTDGNIRYGDGYENGKTNMLDGRMEPVGVQAEVKKLLAPIEPRAIVCIGANYRLHCEETGAPIPERPVVFMKYLSALNNPGDPIVIPACSHEPEVDWEVELAVVIGKAARNVKEEDALDYVMGYTTANDVSARWWQKSGSGGQWIRGKSFDTFCPLGPVMVTPDELTDPQDVRLKTTLNGKVMQDGHTSDMIFPIRRLLADLTRDLTLLPKTVLMTGTPSGVGAGMDPPVFLKPGDEVTVEAEGIGAITNPVVAAG